MSLPNAKKDYTAISIKDSSVSYPPNSKLFCNLCNRRSLETLKRTGVNITSFSSSVDDEGI
jgi:hypothetical protein